MYLFEKPLLVLQYTICTWLITAYRCQHFTTLNESWKPRSNLGSVTFLVFKYRYIKYRMVYTFHFSHQVWFIKLVRKIRVRCMYLMVFLWFFLPDTWSFFTFSFHFCLKNFLHPVFKDRTASNKIFSFSFIWECHFSFIPEGEFCHVGWMVVPRSYLGHSNA